MRKMAPGGEKKKKNLFKLVLHGVAAFSMWEDSHTEEHCGETTEAFRLYALPLTECKLRARRQQP